VESSGPMVGLYKDTKLFPDITLIPMHYYLCGNCGYLETYAAEMDKVARLDEMTNWQKVG